MVDGRKQILYSGIRVVSRCRQSAISSLLSNFMFLKTKIIGAGSIGNHLAQAARRMGWDVTVVDNDPEALRRMKEEIYPKRYGTWDENIKLSTSAEEPKGGFDLICVGTPPDSHIKLALAALKEKPKVLQIEKPLCTPTLEGLNEFLKEYQAQKETIAIVGYDHAISKSINEVVNLLKQNAIGEVETLDVEFREHWQGIFSAHPWLKGPRDTYLGFSKRGGGAAGEHSHALHLWQFLANQAGLGEIKNMNSAMEIKKDNGTDYDCLAAFLFNTDQGKVGRVIQDVITLPVRKWVRLQGSKGYIEWIANGDPKGDVVKRALSGQEPTIKIFEKKRPDDFYEEMLHITALLEGKVKEQSSPLSLMSAVKVMKIIAEAHAKLN